METEVILRCTKNSIPSLIPKIVVFAYNGANLFFLEYRLRGHTYFGLTALFLSRLTVR
jgi:hypothetical protein